MSLVASVTTARSQKKRKYNPTKQPKKVVYTRRRAKPFSSRFGYAGSTSIHSYVRSATNNTLQLTMGGSSTAGQGGFQNTGHYNMQMSFAMDNIRVYLGGSYFGALAVPGVTELAGLYDQYRIDWVELRIGFNVNEAASVSGNNGNLPYMYVVKDYDDLNPADTTALLQYDNVDCIAMGQKPWHIIRIKPRCLTSIKVAPDASTTYTYSPHAGPDNPFIDVANTSVEHMGLKFSYFNPAQPSNTTVYGSIILMCKLHLTMKNAR